ncbi:MAG: hypothetical protein KAJ55_04270, partial [Anaerolineales bacterium]|nr:hypothetical protein [Anaerolineales bacterium]
MRMTHSGHHSTTKDPKRMKQRGQRSSKQNLTRAIRYLGRYKKEAGLAYGAMFIATLAQLMVPQLVQNILDSITDGMIASKIL